MTDLIDAHLVNANTSNPPTTVSTPVSTPEVDSDVSSNPQPTLQPTNRENEQIPNLPSPTPINAHVFTWGNHNATDFSDMLEATYNEVIYWRRNCFTVPLGRIGKAFVSELSKLYSAFASASSLESVALKAAIILPILLLQKPQRTSKNKEHITCLERRLKAWREGNLNDLVLEGRTIQHRLPSLASHHTSKQPRARTFANLMHSGKCKAALNLLANNTEGGVLHLADHVDPTISDSPTVRETLISKHPEGQNPHPNCILPSPPVEIHPVVFNALDANTIRSAALHTTGSAGPSGLDAHEWRRLCTSFQGASNELCHQLAMVARRLCTMYVNPKLIAPFIACRLIALDKNPGVRPIGIGDTARRIIAKAVLSIVKADIHEASGCMQLCGGQISGIEAALHAARSSFESDNNEAILLVDATNAFNSLNRQTALHNIRRICPALATILINTYRDPTDLFVDGDCLLSQEGTTQGDPLAMPMYALATVPLIKRLSRDSITQIWYADDAAAVGKVSDLREWWEMLTKEGPSFGYFPNPNKTWLVTKEGFHTLGSYFFDWTGVNTTSDGRPYLGAPIGSPHYVENYVLSKVSSWCSLVSNLAEFATTQPHAAYSALNHGLSSKWTYLCRTTPNISQLMIPLDEILRTHLLPSLTGNPPPNDMESTLFALPAREGGLGIRIPSKQADQEYKSSLRITSPLHDQIVNQDNQYSHEIISNQLQAKAIVRQQNKERIKYDVAELAERLSADMQRSVKLAKEKGSSSWLTALPLKAHGFVLHKQAFRDALALRYGWTPKKLPSKCACGSSFTVEHALSCAKGGYPSIRHNEIRDLTANLLSEVCNNVCTEPELLPVTGENLSGASANAQPGARLDIAANGVWGGSFERTYFDVRVFNPHAPSNRHTDPQTVYRKHEQSKKRAYEQRIREIEHASFSPLVLSATGGLAREATIFYKKLASMLSSKWDQTYSSTLCWLRCRLAFSLLRSSIQALRGARSSCGHPIRSAAIDLVNSEARLQL